MLVLSISEADDLTSHISGLDIISPQNKTYNSKCLTLNATAYWFFASIDHMFYSTDGQESHELPGKRPSTEFPNPMHGTVIGLATLPELTEGEHSITVSLIGTLYFPETRSYLDQATVYFSIDTTPPIVSGLSVENTTHSQLDLPLNFMVNEPTAWMGYRLDDEANVTLREIQP
jgi:hypothetical protein